MYLYHWKAVDFSISSRIRFVIFGFSGVFLFFLFSSSHDHLVQVFIIFSLFENCCFVFCFFFVGRLYHFDRCVSAGAKAYGRAGPLSRPSRLPRTRENWWWAERSTGQATSSRRNQRIRKAEKRIAASYSPCSQQDASWRNIRETSYIPQSNPIHMRWNKNKRESWNDSQKDRVGSYKSLEIIERHLYTINHCVLNVDAFNNNRKRWYAKRLLN